MKNTSSINIVSAKKVDKNKRNFMINLTIS